MSISLTTFRIWDRGFGSSILALYGFFRLYHLYVLKHALVGTKAFFKVENQDYYFCWRCNCFWIWSKRCRPIRIRIRNAGADNTRFAWSASDAYHLRQKRRKQHRLNMELDLESLFGILCTAVLIGWDPAGSALLVSLDSRYLFVTPWTTAFGLVIRSPRWQVPSSGTQEVDRAVAAARAAFPAWAARSGKLIISCLHQISWSQIFCNLLQICNSWLSHVNQLFVLFWGCCESGSGLDQDSIEFLYP